MMKPWLYDPSHPDRWKVNWMTTLPHFLFWCVIFHVICTLLKGVRWGEVRWADRRTESGSKPETFWGLTRGLTISQKGNTVTMTCVNISHCQIYYRYHSCFIQTIKATLILKINGTPKRISLFLEFFSVCIAILHNFLFVWGVSSIFFIWSSMRNITEL